MWLNLKVCIVFLITFENTASGFSAPRRYVVTQSKSHFKRDRAVPLEVYSHSTENGKIIGVELPISDESFSSSEEPLPVEKGELGIPEQYMKVRHGVYKGQVAVFVDSQSEEGAGYRHFKRKFAGTKTQPLPHPITNTLLTTTTKKTTTTTTTRRPRTKHFSTTTRPTLKVTTSHTTTSRKEPDDHHPPYPTHKPLTKKLKPQGVKNTPVTSAKSSSNSVIKAHSTCLHQGWHCRRHNECCTHHCNWRLGMTCDYAIWK